MTEDHFSLSISQQAMESLDASVARYVFHHMDMAKIFQEWLCLAFDNKHLRAACCAEMLRRTSGSRGDFVVSMRGDNVEFKELKPYD